ncbi:MerR family DNA-binding transcriptional regulator [Streptomyces sp. MZ04]|uniref:MerR family DNA-binding transcriptional regulator n=1 Tax=Streptomyces sp. MZ04 TaxID=2559236 RepID=UPI00107ED75D|nr:MerR family DNA-binding transcriptional regulator [Streptomyces sp. MZ04]TGB00656.1 MerR family DNA-binding transcriptional regulator [Streptomyces sp. MZ04]
MSRAETALRPVDLARAAGVSTQQIRNYADAGILPPTPRTPAGYRRFDTRHRRALLTYRALVPGYGLYTAQAIMRALHADDLTLALTLVDAGHVELHEQRRSLQAAGEALEAVAKETPQAATETPDDTAQASDTPRLRIGEVAARLGVRTSALRVWEAAGLLHPQREPGTHYRWFGPIDVRDARIVSILRQGHYPLPQIQSVLDGLRETGSPDALRAAIAQRLAALTGRGTAMLAASGRLYAYVTGEPEPDQA